MKKRIKKRINKRNLGWILLHRFDRKIDREGQEWMERIYYGKK